MSNYSKVGCFSEYLKKLGMPRNYLVFLPKKVKIEKIKELFSNWNDRKHTKI